MFDDDTKSADSDTSTHATRQQATASITLVCPHCRHKCNSKSGLTNHIKSCKEKSRDEHKTTDIDRAVSVEEFEIPEMPENIGNVKQDVNRGWKPHATKSGPPTKVDKPKIPAKQSTFNIGAFMMFADHVPMMLDINFAITLGEFILEHGDANSNRAILAFGHQLRNLDGDGDEDESA
jgi:hypothetical protein